MFLYSSQLVQKVQKIQNLYKTSVYTNFFLKSSEAQKRFWQWQIIDDIFSKWWNHNYCKVLARQTWRQNEENNQ